MSSVNTHRATIRKSPCSKAAAWNSATNICEALACQNDPSSVPCTDTAWVRASARRNATCSDSHPATGFHASVEHHPPYPSGLNTCTGPAAARIPEVKVNRSSFTEVHTAGPG